MAGLRAQLLEIVEIGKQLLITRETLTTFSIANDIAKYFVIIPALFAGLYPGLDALDVMRLHSPESAILAALRAILVLTLLLGIAYPLAVFAVAQIPGLKHHADGSYASLDGRTVGSALMVSRPPARTASRCGSTSRAARPPATTTRPPRARATSGPRTSWTPCPTRRWSRPARRTRTRA